MPLKGYKQTDAHRLCKRNHSKLTVKERFEEKIFFGSPDGCWYWIGAGMGDGYGQMWDGKEQQAAHRLSFILYKGPIVNDFQVCHSCDNRKCVNPDHLFLGTQLDNIRDMYSKGRNKPLPGRKLNPITACVIREMVKLGATQRKVAAYFDICFQNVSLIVNRKTYAKF